MSFGDISARLKKKSDDKEAAGAPPRDYAELHTLRARILGVLIRDARLSKGLSEQKCASEVGVPIEYFKDWELGKRSPTLPQLEILAYQLEVPVSHFWDTRTISAQSEDRKVPKEEYNDLRDRMIGTLVRIKRKELNLTEQQVAEACGLNPDEIGAYEMGMHPIPFPELSSIAGVLKVPIVFFMEDRGRVGEWLDTQEGYHKFVDLPDEIRDWVLMPSNRAYIEIAMKLSRLPVHELREIGENILDITF
jgi:transcriptional regulator with XRE-family HTH domain